MVVVGALKGFTGNKKTDRKKNDGRKMKDTETNGLESKKHGEGRKEGGGTSSSRKQEMLGRAGSG